MPPDWFARVVPRLCLEGKTPSRVTTVCAARIAWIGKHRATVESAANNSKTNAAGASVVIPEVACYRRTLHPV